MRIATSFATRVVLLVVVAGLTACSPAVPVATIEAVPPVPEAPEGWGSAGAFGGSAAGDGLVRADLTLEDAQVAVNATCVGSGSLVVFLAPSAAAEPVVSTSITFPCGVDAGAGRGRAELADAPTGNVTASAFVIEGGGTIRRAAFNVSIEQPAE